MAAELRTVIEEALMSFQCQHTVQDNDDGGMPLLDMLTPQGDKSVGRGFDELHALADHIVGALLDAGVPEVPHG